MDEGLGGRRGGAKLSPRRVERLRSGRVERLRSERVERHRSPEPALNDFIEMPDLPPLAQPPEGGDQKWGLYGASTNIGKALKLFVTPTLLDLQQTDRRHFTPMIAIIDLRTLGFSFL